MPTETAACPLCHGPSILEESSGHGDPVKGQYSFWRIRCGLSCHPAMETEWRRNAVSVVRDWEKNNTNPETTHPDDIAVDDFAAMMKTKLAIARAMLREGYMTTPDWEIAKKHTLAALGNLDELLRMHQ